MRTLYNYYRSTASYRVRIALNLKGLTYNEIPVHLVKNGGEQHSEEYKKINPQGLVPSYVDENSTAPISQSLAIMEYLEETYPDIPLLPSDAASRAWVRSFSLAIACDIHPINNLGVLQYLQKEFKVTEEQKVQWIQHWIAKGFCALEKMLEQREENGNFCHGNSVTMADICLVAQMYNADRYQCDVTPYPRLNKIVAFCQKLPAFQKAYPRELVE